MSRRLPYQDTLAFFLGHRPSLHLREDPRFDLSRRRPESAAPRLLGLLIADAADVDTTIRGAPAYPPRPWEPRTYTRDELLRRLRCTPAALATAIYDLRSMDILVSTDRAVGNRKAHYRLNTLVFCACQWVDEEGRVAA
jgi:hypothetical protein